MKTIAKTTFPLVIVCFFAGMMSFGLRGQTSRQNAESTYAYFIDCAGRYFRLDVRQQKITSSGSLFFPAASNAQSSPETSLSRPTSPPRFDGCLVNGVQHDANAVYVVEPTELNVDSAGKRHYRIIALRIPTLDILAQFPIQTLIDEAPKILLDPFTKDLIVKYATVGSTAGEPSQTVVQRVKTPDLRASLSARSASEEAFFFLDNNPHWTKKGTIIDGKGIWTQDGKLLDEIDRAKLLDDPGRGKFVTLQRPTADGRGKYLDMTFVDSADDRLLFATGWDSKNDRSRSGSGFLVYDVTEKRPVASFVTRYPMTPSDGTIGTPSAHLTPTGQSVVVEGYTWAGSGDDQQRFKTGQIAVHDLKDDGKAEDPLIITLQPPPGLFARVIGFSPDSRTMYYQTKFGIYAVDLSGTLYGSSHYTKLDVPEGFNPVTVFFSSK